MVRSPWKNRLLFRLLGPNLAGLGLAITFAAVLFGYFSIKENTLNEDVRWIRQVNQDLKDIKALSIQLDADLFASFFQSKNNTEDLKIKALELEKRIQDLDNLVGQKEPHALVNEFKNARAKLLQTQHEALSMGSMSPSRQADKIQGWVQDREETNAVLNKLVLFGLENLEKSFVDYEHLHQAYALAVLVFVLSLIGVTGLLACLLHRWILTPITAISSQANEIAEGGARKKIEVKTHDDEIEGVVGSINRMVLKLSDYNMRLQKEMDKVSQVNSELQQFAYIASHDLKEPLRMVLIYAQLLQKELKVHFNGTTTSYMDRVNTGLTRAFDLIDSLLEYSRAGAASVEKVSIDSAKIIRAVEENLHSLITETQAKITTGPLPAIVGSESQLIQVFQNLVSNGIKFRRDVPPHIHIEGHREGNVWSFVVQDNGIGMEPEDTRQIFQIFQRLHSPEKYPGTGIGLAICKKIIENHGGKISVRSTPGEGSTFTFTLS